MSMNKKIYIILAVVLVVVGYIFFSYRYFYYRLHAGHLMWPDKQGTYQVVNDTKQNGNNKKLYIALGDSLTSGVGVNDYKQSYPYLIAEELANRGQVVTLINQSYPGYKVIDLVNNKLDPTILSKPDLITILIGVNDAHGGVSADAFNKNYDYTLSRLTKETNAKIYLISIPFLGKNSALLPPYNYYFDMKTRNLNKIVKNLANQYSVSYIDLYSATNNVFKKDGSHYSRDGYHPSAVGYKTWARVMCNDICQ